VRSCAGAAGDCAGGAGGAADACVADASDCAGGAGAGGSSGGASVNAAGDAAGAGGAGALCVLRTCVYMRVCSLFTVHCGVGEDLSVYLLREHNITPEEVLFVCVCVCAYARTDVCASV
jgi:hypothetical protein